ncbi:hypothetical protein [Streptomyces sp. NPDC002588]|uniref:hypothetical protein n=1 Tax=Streptomyces sp. NPDC002588 TaxID=3154419 RepID=UPI0033196EF9
MMETIGYDANGLGKAADITDRIGQLFSEGRNILDNARNNDPDPINGDPSLGSLAVLIDQLADHITLVTDGAGRVSEETGAKLGGSARAVTHTADITTEIASHLNRS